MVQLNCELCYNTWWTKLTLPFNFPPFVLTFYRRIFWYLRFQTHFIWCSPLNLNEVNQHISVLCEWWGSWCLTIFINYYFNSKFSGKYARWKQSPTYKACGVPKDKVLIGKRKKIKCFKDVNAITIIKKFLHNNDDKVIIAII